MAVALRQAGYPVSEVVSRDNPASQRRAERLARRTGARATTIRQPRLRADVVWLCVPDRDIASCAKTLAGHGEWDGKTALHASGALSSRELHPLQRRGAAVASVHPLMTFVAGVHPSLAEVPFAIEGDPAAVRVARRMVRDLGGKAFQIEKRDKPAYHAWGAFTSPLLLAALVAAERVAGLAGIRPEEARRRMQPIVRQTLANYVTNGPAGAFSGPIIRGDAATIGKHLRILERLPDAKQVYIALARIAVKNLPTKNRRALEKALR